MARNILQKQAIDRQPAQEEMAQTPQPQQVQGQNQVIKEVFSDPQLQILNDKINYMMSILFKLAEAAEIDLSH